MKPLRMVELECPHCERRSWVIDPSDRPCPTCGEPRTGMRVLRRSPTMFFLQPHDGYPMSTREFAEWLAIWRTVFGEPSREQTVGVSWYPGEAGLEQEERVHEALRIGEFGSLRLSLTSRPSGDERIRVAVQQGDIGFGDEYGEATFFCSDEVTLEHCIVGFRPDELERVREVLLDHAPEIRQAWGRFAEMSRTMREFWLPRLAWPPIE